MKRSSNDSHGDDYNTTNKSKILWDFEIQIYYHIQMKRPDMVINKF